MGQGGSNLDGLSQKQLRRGISKTEALAGEAESFLIELAPLPRYQLLNLHRPLLPQVVASGLFKFQQGPSAVHAQTEGGDFASTFQRR